MARRTSVPPQPVSAVLTVDQMRLGVKRLQRRIDELEAFDPATIQRRFDPAVEGIEKGIEETLSTVFGHGTVEYIRYRSAARLDNGPISMAIEPDWITARGGGYGARGDNMRDVHRYLLEGKEQALSLLQRAVRGLEEQIQDASELLGDQPSDSRLIEETPLDLSRVFIVHGRDEGAREGVARFIERLGFKADILHELPNKGRTIITKFREEAEGVGFAVVLMTPDDQGKGEHEENFRPRARQNVVFELGFFIGILGPGRVAALVKGPLERPSDFDGVVYIPFDDQGWKLLLARELREAGYQVDLNKV